MAIDPEDRKELIALARAAVESAVRRQSPPTPQRTDGVLGQKRGCFVTLTNHGDLRGCIGTFQPDMPLAELPRVAARAAIEAIVLSGSAEVSAAVIETDLPRLCRITELPVFIGGRVVDRYPEALTAAGAILLEEDLSLALRRIGATGVRR